VACHRARKIELETKNKDTDARLVVIHGDEKSVRRRIL